ncbi:GNAT family N-acetyltransferase [Halarcobacter sp.]|uniref:GNAT family N-acetyltransferase n=1 Tax=Halarcobacter sp. TaxID=2321133 RepID=UPI002AA79040|nr:GNAT family N-acetyltransferase [Halarcobacter sp.]
MENEKKIRFEKCHLEKLDDIIEIGKDTYFDTFSKYCSEEVMKDYLEKAFDVDKIREEIMNKDSSFFFIYLNEELSGYLKLNINEAQCDLRDENGLEIERIYVKEGYKGKGLGSRLINFGIEKAKEYEKEFVWVGVWEKNKAGIEFYNKNGFYEIGMHSFRMGDEIQNDYIMKKDIKKENRIYNGNFPI